jgi:hypothetical protein
MIKKSVFEDELIAGMKYQLSKQAMAADVDHLDKAVDYLNSAASILDDIGMVKIANKVVLILDGIGSGDGKKTHQCYPNGEPDKHTLNLTPEKMVENLKDHGTVFTMDKNDNSEESEEDVLEVSDDFDEDFEDEAD